MAPRARCHKAAAAVGKTHTSQRGPEQEQQTTSGIILPDTLQHEPMVGTVVAVGPGEYDSEGTRTPTQVREGDRIVFGKCSGTELYFDENRHLLLREEDILGVVIR